MAIKLKGAQMDNSKSDNKKKSNQCYIEVIDDTITDDYLKYQNTSTVFGYVFVYLIVVMPIVGIVGVLSNSAIMVMMALLVTIIITVFIYQNNKKKRLDKLGEQRKKAKTERVPISKRELSNLKELLERIGNITMSYCDGFVTKPSQMVGIQAVPLYGLASNPTFHRYAFIRTDCDSKYILNNEKKLILKVFGLEKENGVIWISQKNVAKWTMLSNFPVINFVDESGDKMCFGRYRYASFYNHHELTTEDGKCVIHIKDKRPDNREILESEIDVIDEERTNDDGHYDEDI